MTEIGRVNKHKTTHQDGGDDELVLTGILPGVHKTTHQDAGADEIDATGLAGRCDFVDRGDPTAVDFSGAQIVTDAAWNELDLSSIVPAGAKLVLLRVVISDDVIDSSLKFRKNGNTNTYNISSCRTQVANLQYEVDLIVPLDANRKIEVIGSNVVWNAKQITVAGWFI